MLLIIFLSLIAQLTSASGNCVVGPQNVNVNWNKVGMSVLTQFLKQAAFGIAAWVLYFSCCFINELPTEHIRMFLRVIE